MRCVQLARLERICTLAAMHASTLTLAVGLGNRHLSSGDAKKAGPSASLPAPSPLPSPEADTLIDDDAMPALEPAVRQRLIVLLKRHPSLADEALALVPADARRLALARAMKELRVEFERANKNKDGLVSWKEFSNWAEQLLEESKSDVPTPSTTQLAYLCLRSAVPFVGFGMVDNGLMVLTGEAIDTQLGVLLGITTMAAAALGNATSNVVGMGAHGTIERFVGQLGIPDPHLSQKQLALSRVHLMKVLSSVMGVFAGYLLGMLIIHSARVFSSSSVHNDVLFASESAVPAGLPLRLSIVTTTEKNSTLSCRTRRCPCHIVAAAAFFHVPLSLSSQPPMFDFHHQGCTRLVAIAPGRMCPAG
ncbi:hypothetical protein T492DRAFT_1032784 [Pavlovales sp. CCMP2436]|nr:hypothetical protein T492DRAFT_1032784 [Pavlovales sp. CCMP2436]